MKDDHLSHDHLISLYFKCEDLYFLVMFEVFLEACQSFSLKVAMFDGQVY